jgi:hypothetical protein
VSFGLIQGRLIGVIEGVVVACCSGSVGGIEAGGLDAPSPFIVPPGGLMKFVGMELFVPEQIAYTPVSAVPEPTSVLLLGSALTAAR